MHKNLIPFKKGDPNINRTGLNKGSKWKKSLLKDLLNLNITKTDDDQFKELKEKFPKQFDSIDNDKNYHLFMELKQMSLVFNKDPKVSQNAINAIKDRVEGKPNQSVYVETEIRSIQILNNDPFNDSNDDSVKKD